MADPKSFCWPHHVANPDIRLVGTNLICFSACHVIFGGGQSL